MSFPDKVRPVPSHVHTIRAGDTVHPDTPKHLPRIECIKSYLETKLQRAQNSLQHQF